MVVCFVYYVFLLLCVFHSVYSVSLCRSVYCLCVNVYCTVLLPQGGYSTAVYAYISVPSRRIAYEKELLDFLLFI